MLSGDFSAHVQFGPATVKPMPGYVADNGAVFADRGDGLSYGWDRAKTAKPAARKPTDLSPDERYDSFVAAKRDAVWNIAVPNGTYAVRVIAGDSKTKKAVYAVDAEGTPVLRGNATRAGRFVTGENQITVTDGMLTLTTPADAPKAKNRLAFIDIVPVGSRFDPGVGGVDTTGFTPLFNGKDLTGFYTWIDGLGKGNDPQQFFKVEDGMLHVLGIPPTSQTEPFGYLSTMQDYSDYDLLFQYKWGTNKFAPRDASTDQRDSGMLFHVNGPDGIWPASVEAQVMESNTGDIWLLGLKAGQETFGTTTVVDASKSQPTYSPDGETDTLHGGRIVASQSVDSASNWNTVLVSVHGDSADVSVNGVHVNHVENVKAPDGSPLTSGRILFQAEGAETWYRNIQIRDHNAAPAGAVQLFNGTDTANFVRRDDAQPIGWDVKDGALTVVPGTGDVRSVQTFEDYRLHMDFNVPKTSITLSEQARGNSGLALAGSYELQILDSYGETLSGQNDVGAIYGIKDADINAARPAGHWQTYDVTFTAPRWTDGVKTANARVTAYLNGQLIQNDVEIPTSTFTWEPETPGPRPIMLQDHQNAVRFRNIWVEPLGSHG